MKKVQRDALKIIGLKVRTNNANGGKDIMALWENFNKLGLQPKNGKFYGVYCNYESDHTGDYDLFVGVEDSGEITIPDGEHVTLVAGEYTEFPVEGKMPESVFAAWQKVRSSDIKRSYQTDFEEYYFDGKNPPQAIVFIG